MDCEGKTPAEIEKYLEEESEKISDCDWNDCIGIAVEMAGGKHDPDKPMSDYKVANLLVPDFAKRVIKDWLDYANEHYPEMINEDSENDRG